MRKTLLSLAFVPTLATGAVTDGSFVHLFEWSWSDVAQECEDWLGPKGYQAVQVSPPMEHIEGSQWWTRYQPVSYTLTSRSGNLTEFQDMAERCKSAGVEVIADAVINHMAASPSGTAYGVAGTSFYGRSFEPYAYDAGLMHHLGSNTNTNCAVTDYTNATNVQQCDLVGLVDLDSESADVQQIVGDYISSLVAAGAGGIRVDAAKHINADSLGQILARGPTNLYNFQEVIYGDGEAVQPEEYTDNGEVTEFRFGTNIYDNFNEGAQGKMVYLETFGESWGMIDSSSAVTFTDNHDTQRSASNVLTYKDGQYYNQANYFMLAHPYGHPKVMSSYYFTDSDAGPPPTPVHGSDGALNCDDGTNWVCEHRRTGIAGMVGFRLATQAAPTATNWQYDDANANRVAFARPSLGFFALNMDAGSAWSADSLDVGGLPDGTYCNVVASSGALEGDCDDADQVTVSGGKASFTVPSLNAVAFHVGSAL